MSDLQKEASGAAMTGKRYAIVKAVFDALPNRFSLRDVFVLAGIKDSLNQRMAYAVVLYRDFKCDKVTHSGKREWVKPYPARPKAMEAQL